MIPVTFFLTGYIWQIGIVEYDSGAEGQIGNDKKYATQPPKSACQEKHQNRCYCADGCKDAHHLFAQMGVICYCTENRQE